MIDREQAAAQALRAVPGLAEQGVAAVALTFVDNAGITRVKTVPLGRLEEVARLGVGMSPVFDVFLVDDSVTRTAQVGGPVGDLRLLPDISRLVPLRGQPGWAWAPVDRVTQEGEEYAVCQRSFARRMAAQAAAVAGLELQMGFEVEWVVSRGDGDALIPACTGPAYGMTRVVELSDYARDLLEALAGEDVEVLQFHPEYAAAQMELSVAPADPVTAADLNVLVRQTVRAVSARHGLRVSFAPRADPDAVGNGGHLHLSVWADGLNLLAGGGGPRGVTQRGESVLAGLLDGLPALCAIGAPSVTSYRRLVPSHWAGCYQCWGHENREAALRLVTGPRGHEGQSANVEIKCFDLAANPYLVVGAVIAVVLDAADRWLRLPAEVTDDPAVLGDDDALAARGIRRLPTSMTAAADALEACAALRRAMGEPLVESFLAVRRAEAELFADMSPEEAVAATRWRY